LAWSFGSVFIKKIDVYLFLFCSRNGCVLNCIKPYELMSIFKNKIK